MLKPISIDPVQLIDDILSELVPVRKKDDMKTLLSIERSLIASLRQYAGQNAKQLIALCRQHIFTPSGKITAMTAQATSKKLIEALEAAGNLDKTQVAKTVTETMKAAYFLGKNSTTRGLELQGSTALIDQKTLAWCSQDCTYWIGRHYTDDIKNKIVSIVVDDATQWGGGQVEAGERLKAEFGQTFQRSDAYWRGLAGTVLSRSRNFGCVAGYEEAGVATYEILAVMDERTSPICRYMNGKVFTVKDAANLRDTILNSKRPDDVRKNHPWLRLDQVQGLSDDELVKMGQALPPYHFFCRTTTVMRDFEPTKQDTEPIDLQFVEPEPSKEMPTDLNDLKFVVKSPKVCK